MSALLVNGVDGRSGEYLPSVESLDMLGVRLRVEWGFDAPPPPVQLGARAPDYLGVVPGVDLRIPRQAGWGIVFASNSPPRVRDQLAPLIAHRRSRLGAAAVKELDYHPGEDLETFLDRHDATLGTVDPANVPYYLLVIGAGSEIPFSFCHELDIDYAVGGLSFDEPEHYGAYAKTVIDYESAAAAPCDRIDYFATQHDPATQQSAAELVLPLVASRAIAQSGDPAVPTQGEAATSGALRDLLVTRDGRARPRLLFTATHGLRFGRTDPLQRAHQGALLCNGWIRGRPARDHAIGAAELAGARFDGLIAFFFACFGAGTEEYDRFDRAMGHPGDRLAERSFVAELPRTLLRNGALAVFGHVDRVWSCSFAPRLEPRIDPFRNALSRIVLGEPLGRALDDFNKRFATKSARLATLFERMHRLNPVDRAALAEVWLERNDAEGFLLLGDPALALAPRGG